VFELTTPGAVLEQAASELVSNDVLAELTRRWEALLGTPGKSLQEKVEDLMKEIVELAGREQELCVQTVEESALLEKLCPNHRPEDRYSLLELGPLFGTAVSARLGPVSNPFLRRALGTFLLPSGTARVQAPIARLHAKISSSASGERWRLCCSLCSCWYMWRRMMVRTGRWSMDQPRMHCRRCAT
jgi:hypothetical protein